MPIFGTELPVIERSRVGGFEAVGAGPKILAVAGGFFGGTLKNGINAGSAGGGCELD
jgi:hypothetical protein